MVQRDNESRFTGRRAKRAAFVLEVVALLLVAVFAAAVLHELLFVLLGHDHDRDACPLCLLIRTPVLLGACVLLGARFVPGRSVLLPCQEVLSTRSYAVQADPRAPPLL